MFDFEERTDWRNEAEGAPQTILYAEDLLRYEAAHAAAAGEIRALQQSRSGQEIGYAIYSDQFTASTASWEQIPGLELTFPTGDRPVYLTLDLGLIAVEGVQANSASLSYRILDVVNQIPIRNAYVTATRSTLTGPAEYLLTQSVAVTARIPAASADLRYVVQVMVPEDQIGPSWYLNVAWAQGIDLILKAVTV